MKTAGKIALGVFAGVVGISAMSYALARHQVFNQNAKLISPPGKVTIIMAAWYETNEVLLPSLSSLKNQNLVQAYPSSFEFLVVGCDGVDMSLVKYFSDVTTCAANGKLNARDKGIKLAKGDIIVAVDADTYYPPNWLNMLLAPMSNPKVVAVQSITDHGMPLNEVVFQPYFQGFYIMRLSGRGSAFRKSAYFASGGFNLSINQRNMDQMVREEELNFKERLGRFGIVSYVNAPVFHLSTGAKTGGLHVKA